MTENILTQRFVVRLARRLRRRGLTMPASRLAGVLNRFGYTTGYGAQYKGERGTYKVAACAFLLAERERDQEAATAVAEAFVRPDGSYAWPRGE